MRRAMSGILTITMLGVSCSVLVAAEWGNLSGQIVYDGAPPTPEKAVITADKEVCCLHDVIVESLLVDPQSKGVKDVIIYLYQDKSGRRRTEEDEKAVPIHESYEALKNQPVHLDNSKCRFDPHVALIWNARTVVIGNSDPIGHNVKILITGTSGNLGSNDTVPSGGSMEKRFGAAEKLPVMVSCSIHPWMKGWLVIRDTPYMAVTDEQGKFEIQNVPAGKWRFMFWQEAAGYVDDVEIGGKPQKWSRGIVEIDIQPGENDLGKIVVAPDLFK